MLSSPKVQSYLSITKESMNSSISHEMLSSLYPQIQTIDDYQNMFQVNPFAYNLEASTTTSTHENLPILNMDHIHQVGASNSSDNTTINTTPNIEESNQNEMKLVIRRDVERRRRQEMTILYSSLRSLLPLEYIKGKRSISDHMNQATIYIKHLQKKTQMMKDRRDRLKKRLYNISESSVVTSSLSPTPDFATVRPCFSGLEIVISTNNNDGLLHVSSVLQALLANGLTVNSCVSTRVNERSLHTIQAEVADLKGINTMELQQKLMDLIKL